MVIALFLVGPFWLKAQEIVLTYNNLPLSEVLMDLHNQHKIEFSFNSTLANNCFITINGGFTTLDEALTALTMPCNLEFVKSNGIYILRGATEGAGEKHVLKGKVLDKSNGESLPFTELHINGSHLTSNANGDFTYQTPTAYCSITSKHLGYFELDTTVKSNEPLTIELEPVYNTLGEVVVKDDNDKRPFASQQPLTVKTNRKTALLYPGGNQNTLLSFMRLQAGVLAAGEQTKDFIVQGSYRGQSQVDYEGITLLGTGSYNEYLGVVNPLMIKDIEIKKGGYSALQGNRVGGLVTINALDGNKTQRELDFLVNNQTFSGYVNLPIAGKSSLQVASRQTFYHLYPENSSIGLYNDIAGHRFGDVNAKYQWQPAKGWLVSFNGAFAREGLFLNYQEKLKSGRTYRGERSLASQQRGLSFNAAKIWKNGSITSLTSAYSGFTRLDSTLFFFRERQRLEVKKVTLGNDMGLFTHQLVHRFAAKKRHQLTARLLQESVSSLHSNIRAVENQQNRMGFAIADHISLKNRLHLDLSLGGDWLNADQWYWQPRTMLTYTLSRKWKFFSSWGLYRQFYSNDGFIDERRNFNFQWVAYNQTEEITRSQQVAAGSIFQQGNFLLKVEGYYKTLEGLNRWVFRPTGYQHFEGDAFSQGLDISLARTLKKWEYGVNYTLSQTLEHFDYFPTEEYRRAPQDQLHELKTHLVHYMGPLIFTANFVYGSGLFVNPTIDNYPYQRLDVAGMYRLTTAKGKWIGDAGVSILNVLNRKNLRPNYFISYQEGNVDIPTGIPFTPTVYVHLRF